jgi:hypothetical protein
MNQKKPTVEPTGPYRPGMVVASDAVLSHLKGGMSRFNAKTGKTEEPPEKKR